MSRSKKTKDEIKKQSELNQILSDIRKDITLTIDLVKLLEGIPDKQSKQHENFCKSYTIVLFQKYIKDKDDREMMLAACGLLKGFEFQEQQLDKRMTDYRQYAQEHNTWIKRSWVASSYATKYRSKLNEIVIKLEQDLTSDIAKNKGKLGIIEEVSEKLEYPEPQYTFNRNKTKDDKIDEKKLLTRLEIFRCIMSIITLVFSCSCISNNKQLNNDSEPIITKIIAYEQDITLTPKNPSKHLNIGIFPTDADIHALNYSSSNNEAVIVQEQFVSLAPNWSEASSYTSNITIKAGDVTNKDITVTAQKIDDSNNLEEVDDISVGGTDETKNVSEFRND